MGGDADRPHARPSASVRDAERLMEVEVAHVDAEIAGPTQPDLRVHIRAVHIHLPPGGVHDFADPPHPFLKDPVGGWVSHHHGGEVGVVLSGLGLEIGKVHVPLFVTGHRHDFEPGHHRAGGVGPVGRYWDQTDVPVTLTPMAVVGPDRHEPGILPLRSGVRLE